MEYSLGVHVGLQLLQLSGFGGINGGAVDSWNE